MRLGSIVLAIIFATCSVTVAAGAGVPREEGEAPFEFAARFETTPQVGRTVALRLEVLDFDPGRDSVTMRARIELPAGWEVMEGEPSRQVRTAERELRWSIKVRPNRAGRFELRRSLSIDRGRWGIDEGEYVLPVAVRTDSSIVGDTKNLRLETVQDGQRFRYGDRYLVPIDGPEDFTQAELAVRARVVGQQEALCGACTARDPVSVTWVAFVGPAGQLKAARLASAIPPTSPAIQASREALGAWSFASAKVRGRPVADWVVVHVPVRR